jgi:HNH endonuclease
VPPAISRRLGVGGQLTLRLLLPITPVDVPRIRRSSGVGIPPGVARRRARGTYEWKQARAAAQRRDGFRCVRCGLSNRKTKLEVHHVNGVSTDHRLENLETLCFRHHREAGGGRAGVETASRVHPPPDSRGFNRKSSSREEANVGEGEVFIA